VTHRTHRKVRWDSGRLRAYVLRDEVRYWAPQETVFSQGDAVQVLNPTPHSVTVKGPAWSETWRADATSAGENG
jgi:hypothetical protein